ncbi:MAG: class I tRNA ligase family protein, partial [Candidatus Aenigmatarchaeota archaeon]
SRQILLNWIDSISIDWPISRRRYYATEIPLWYCKKCNEPIIPPKGKYYRPWLEPPPIKKCPKCGHQKFRGEERVLDTWFDSSNTPLYILGYSSDKKFFKKNTPCSLRPQGFEIVRSWLYYTVLKDYLLTGDCIFRDVFIHRHVLDEKGHKMSKSLGNTIDPVDVLDKFGAEPFRLWTVIEGNLTKTDFRCSFEKIAGIGKFLTKLWNIARFIEHISLGKNNRQGEISLTPLDRWILQEADKLVRYSKKRYACYDFHNPVTRLKHFIWGAFASHYIELAKTRAYNPDKKFSQQEQQAAIYSLNRVLDTILLLLAPVVPFVTYKIYRELRGQDIHLAEFPRPDPKIARIKLPFTTEQLVGFDSAAWKAKKDKGLSLKTEVKRATIPAALKPVEADLKKAHNIKEAKYGKTPSFSF